MRAAARKGQIGGRYQPVAHIMDTDQRPLIDLGCFRLGSEEYAADNGPPFSLASYGCLARANAQGLPGPAT
jgi:hypothetical protein